MRESPLFVKTYDLLAWLIPHTLKFPKSQRFVLAKRIQDAVLDFNELILEASKLGGEIGVLRRADARLEAVRLYVRLSKDLKLFSIGQYEHCMGMVNEIGKLLGGWIKRELGKSEGQ